MATKTISNNTQLNEIKKIVQQVKFLALDVDGVLTDGGIILTAGQDESKRFDVQDGMGIRLAQKTGMQVGIITSRTSKIVEARCYELGISDIHQGVPDKTQPLELILKKYDIGYQNVSYIGDDIQDLPIMKKIGLPIAVQNARELVKQSSLYITDANGGHGAVREAIEWILKLNGSYETAIAAIIDRT